jgi:hypothetical protein
MEAGFKEQANDATRGAQRGKSNAKAKGEMALSPL